MAHDVRFSIPERALGKADVEFIVKEDGAVLGTLAVSNGSIGSRRERHTATRWDAASSTARCRSRLVGSKSDSALSLAVQRTAANNVWI